MPLSDNLRDFLFAYQAEFTLTDHSNAFTAREVAAAEHLPAREVAKTIVVTHDDRFFMLVVPANKLIDFHKVCIALELARARMATEHELGLLFPDCEMGAMPPFGRLYGLPVYLDSTLTGQDHIAFNAGTHREVIHMRTAEYRRLARPAVASLIQTEVADGG
jgi:Ala-tRNA(Pro) deacylase